MKPRTSVRRWKSVDEQPGCSWMIGIGARPEEAVFSLNPLVAHAGIVGRTVSGGAAKLIEHLGGTLVREARSDLEPVGERAQDIEIGPDALRRFEHTTAQRDAPLEIRGGTVFLSPLGAG